MIYNKTILLVLSTFITLFIIQISSAFADAWSKNIVGSDCQINGISFNINIGNIYNVPDLAVPVNFSCTGFAKNGSDSVQDGYRPVYCWHIHGGLAAGNGDYPLREAKKGLDELYFTLRADTGLWGYQAIGSLSSTPYNVAGEIPWDGKQNSVSWNTNTVLHFEGNENASSLPQGSYKYNTGRFHIAVGQIPKDQPLTRYNACGGSTNWDILSGEDYYKYSDFQIAVKTYCTVSTEKNIDFGKAINLNFTKPTTGRVNVDCSAGTDFALDINGGLHYDKERCMYSSDTNQYISYNLDHDHFEGVGTGSLSGIDYTINASLPKQDTPKLGLYKDTLIATVTRTDIPQ